MKKTISVFVLGLFVSTAGHADSLVQERTKDEIRKHVFEPCVIGKARKKSSLDGYSDEEIIEMTYTVDPAAGDAEIDKLAVSLFPLFEKHDSPADMRKTVYTTYLEQCIRL